MVQDFGKSHDIRHLNDWGLESTWALELDRPQTPGRLSIDRVFLDTSLNFCSDDGENVKCSS